MHDFRKSMLGTSICKCARFFLPLLSSSRHSEAIFGSSRDHSEITMKWTSPFPYDSDIATYCDDVHHKAFFCGGGGLEDLCGLEPLKWWIVRQFLRKIVCSRGDPQTAITAAVTHLGSPPILLLLRSSSSVMNLAANCRDCCRRM